MSIDGDALMTQEASSSVPKADPAARRRAPLVFVLEFVGLLLAFQLLFELWIKSSDWFAWYLRENAALGALILRGLGAPVHAIDNVIESEGYSLAILPGCDGLQPLAIFLIGVVAYPARARRKLSVMVTGTLLLLTLNLMRILSLYYIGVDWPGAFVTAHEEVWPVGFGVVAFVLWLAWAQRVSNSIASSAPPVRTTEHA